MDTHQRPARTATILTGCMQRMLGIAIASQSPLRGSARMEHSAVQPQDFERPRDIG
jgi:hypothetical protein